MTIIDDPTQLVRAIADGSASPGDLDRLIALGAPALPALIDGLADGANVPTLTTALAALRVPDPLATFAPLLAHGAMAVRAPRSPGWGRRATRPRCRSWPSGCARCPPRLPTRWPTSGIPTGSRR